MFQPLPTASMSVGQLFADPNRFHVPIYQRPYSWTVEEATQLLADIAEAAGVDGGEPLENDYFLGAILLLDTDRGELADTRTAIPARDLEIVDGQQRLVTLTILAAALRDLAPSGSDVARRLDALVRPASTSANGSSRIALSGEAWNFFVDFVLTPGSCRRAAPDGETFSIGNRAVLEARDRLLAGLEQFSPEQRQALANYMCDCCHLVVVITSDIDRAHRIFMILNDRGRPLQKKDILKAEILRAVETEHRDAALAVWKEVEAQLGDEMEVFFSHLRAARGYHRQQVISGVRSAVRQAGGARAFVYNVFQPLAAAYAMILSATGPHAPVPQELRRPLIGLLRLSGSEWVPSALLVLSRTTDAGLARTYLDEIERAAFLMRLVCLGAGKRQTRFAKIASLLSGPTLPAPGELYEPTREEMRTVAYNLKDLHSRNVQACKALLLRLNDELQPGALYSNPTHYTVEHVLPLRPKATSLWRQWFPDTEERMTLTSSLGNLVLVSQGHNDRARNDEYARKKEIYATARRGLQLLAITDDVLLNDKWGGEEIRRREARFIALLNSIWRLEIEAVRVEEAVTD